jgi:hypothetical protein
MGAAGNGAPPPGTAAPSTGIDFAYECSRVVRAVDMPGAFRGWDYRGEDPYQDMRGNRVERFPATRTTCRTATTAAAN